LDLQHSMMTKSKMPILYSYRRCPYAMRARMALKLAGIEVEIREISLRDKPAHMLQASPKATVPVLILADSSVVDESLAIMDWAFCQPSNLVREKTNATGLEHSSASLQASIHAASRALVLMNDTEFKKNLDCYKYPERYPTQSQLEYRAQGEVFLQQLEDLLQQNTYLFGSEPSFADYAIFPFVRQFVAVDAAWFEQSNYPKLRAWLAAWIESDLFKSVMTKNPTFIV
jgi:glutathione S-transferase